MPMKIPTAGEVSNWSMDKLLEYGRGGLRDHKNDADELIIRRNILLTSDYNDQSPILREVVMLSFMGNDFETVRKVLGWLEVAGDPAMGYHLFKILRMRGEVEEAEKYLTSSADSGYLPAQKLRNLKEARERGVLGVFLIPIVLLKHAIKVYKLARVNPNDIRIK